MNTWGIIAGGPCPYRNCCPRPGAPGGYTCIRGATEGAMATGLIWENCACKKQDKLATKSQTTTVTLNMHQ